MKINYLLSAALAVVSVGMTGCSQSEDVADGTTAKQTITFASGEDETTTRTSMGGKYTDASFPFYWEKGDAIWVNATNKITGDNTGTAARALFTGNVTTSAPYNIRYTGTGHYETTNSRTGITVSTTSDANTLVIPPVQSIATWDEGADTKRIGANGDCGTATATGSGNSYSFKLAHKAAYLILMPRWGTGGTNTTYKLKSVTVISQGCLFQLSGRFKLDDSGIGSPIADTQGSPAIKVITGGSDGITLPTAIDQTKSINIAIKPIAKEYPLGCIYEITDGKNTYYIEKIILDKSYPENSVTPITADIKKGYDMANLGQDENGKPLSSGPYLDLITNNNPYSDYCEWDAPVGEQWFVSQEMDNDYANNYKASASCKNCPTLFQANWYVKGGCYLDADKVWGPASWNKGVVWFKKKAYLISSGVCSENDFNNKEAGGREARPQKTKPSDLNTNWFCLICRNSFISGARCYPLSMGWAPGYHYNMVIDMDYNKDVSVGVTKSEYPCYLWSVQ